MGDHINTQKNERKKTFEVDALARKNRTSFKQYLRKIEDELLEDELLEDELLEDELLEDELLEDELLEDDLFKYDEHNK